jgi:hypothetical protein
MITQEALMIQLYFLSILCNGLTGCMLILEKGADQDSIESSLGFTFHNSAFRLILAILSVIIGILKLLSPALDSRPIILGDLIPALAGILSGFILFFGYYRERASVSGVESALDRIGGSFLKYKRAVGLALFVSAALHFLFPKALFL